MKKNTLLITLLSAMCSLNSAAQLSDIPMENGKYDANWESLEQWECPEWFQDAKFGLWAHWGPQCQANSGDWYARYMYDGQTHWDEEMNAYINCKEYGFKEYCRDWKADKWDPEAIMEKYAKVGAKYFFALANHHDNFDCWDSPYQEWNCTNIGPMKDLGKGWAEACRKRGIKFGMSVHASHAWTWYEIGRKYGDVRLTKADGVGQWWEGYDPNELYAQAHETVSSGWDNIGNIHNQWNWGNGASIPDAAYKTKLQNRCRQMVQALEPDVVYFDDTVLPFYGCDNQWGQDFLAYYYNYMSNRGKEVVSLGKVLPEAIKECMMWDVERGIPDRPQKKPWQTDTCIGGWHYAYHDRGHYKSAATVIRMLIDIVSKNGNLMLSIPLKGEGTYDEQEAEVLDGIQAWMEINSESIYGTRVWKNFGEGPLAEATNGLNGQGFNEGQSYSSDDVRFVHRNDTVYATIMAWPTAGEYTMKSFSMASEYYNGQVKEVTLLGYGKVNFKQTLAGLIIDVPATHPNEIAPAFRITFNDEIIGGYDMLKTMTEEIDNTCLNIAGQTSNINSGIYNTQAVRKLQEANEKAKKVTASSSDEEIEAAKSALINAYQNFAQKGINKGGLWSGTYTANLTTDKLVQASGFARSEGGTARFGKPANWTVENFNIPNGSDGTKAGLDKYSGNEALMLGVWNDASSNNKGDLTNARIYRKVKLEKGTYFFGASFNACYQMSPQAYMFASTEICDTKDIPSKALAYYRLSNFPGDMTNNGIWFEVPEDMDVYIGFQANLKNGSSTQEFRAEKVALYRVATVGLETLTKLTTEVSKKLTSIASLLKEINTGYYDPAAYNEMLDIVNDINGKIDTMTDPEAQDAYYLLNDTWTDFQLNGLNKGGVLDTTGTEDITIEKLMEKSRFTRKDPNVTTRFATPLYWTVANFKIPNGSDGTKNGLDKYSGQDALMLGVWNDREKNASGSLGSARIYQQITLSPGTYFFGASFNAIYQLNLAHMYVNDKLIASTYVPKKSIAYLNISECGTDGQTYGMKFRLDEEQTVYICFQANLASGSTTQEFRAETVTLLRYDTPTSIETIYSGKPMVQNGIYTLDGRRHDTLQSGVNIVKTANGKTTKVLKR